MGLLDRAIKQGINKAVGSTVANAVEKKATEILKPKVERTVNQVADDINRTTGDLNKAAGNTSSQTSEYTSQYTSQNANQAANSLGGLFASLQSSATSFANEAAKNMKICPACNEPTDAEKKFCPSCGAKLPEQTLAQGAVCSTCGKQNDIGIKFCSDCGAKLPSAIAEENAAKAKDEAVLAEWDTKLSQYPKWCFGGNNYELEELSRDEYGRPIYTLYVRNTNRAALGQYRELLLQNGFRQAGKYPSPDMLYKKVNGECFCFESCESFASEDDLLQVGFRISEPQGGFDYVKPEPTKPKGLRDLFGL